MLGSEFEFIFNDTSFQEVSGLVSQYKDEINEIYNFWPNMTEDDKKFYLDMIESMRIVIIEGMKYLYSYKSTSQKTDQEFLDYTVSERETLVSIANKLYDGDFSRWEEIYLLNNLSDNKLSIGQILKVRPD